VGRRDRSLLATLHLSLTDPDFDDDTVYDHLAEQLLRLLGIPPDEAHDLATLPLPVPSNYLDQSSEMT
jgi:hypothetical protein